MAKSLVGQLAILLLSLLPLIFAAAGNPDPFTEELASTTDWRESLGVGKEKVTKLHFFLHDIATGDNPSAVLVAQAATSYGSPSIFGRIIMIDDSLTVGPEPDSEEIGRAQGMYCTASQREGTLDLLMAVNYCFTYGKYNGSCINLFSSNAALNPVRELSIVGGTALFRLARGVVIARSHFFNLTSYDSIIEYDVTVLHYD